MCHATATPAKPARRWRRGERPRRPSPRHRRLRSWSWWWWCLTMSDTARDDISGRRCRRRRRRCLHRERPVTVTAYVAAPPTVARRGLDSDWTRTRRPVAPPSPPSPPPPPASSIVDRPTCTYSTVQYSKLRSRRAACAYHLLCDGEIDEPELMRETERERGRSPTRLSWVPWLQQGNTTVLLTRRLRITYSVTKQKVYYMRT